MAEDKKNRIESGFHRRFESEDEMWKFFNNPKLRKNNESNELDQSSKTEKKNSNGLRIEFYNSPPDIETDIEKSTDIESPGLISRAKAKIESLTNFFLRFEWMRHRHDRHLYEPIEGVVIKRELVSENTSLLNTDNSYIP
jgi:hypothetical protein